MSSFIVKTITFLVVLILLIQIPSFFLPDYWGNDSLMKKFRHLENSHESFNSYFLGTSRVLNGLDPVMFDRYSKIKTKSFNLGVAGSPGMERFGLLDELIENPKYNTKVIICEFPLFTVPSDRLASSVRGRYFVNTHVLYNFLKIMKYDKILDFSDKLNGIAKMNMLWVKNLFKVGLLKGQFRAIRSKNKYYNVKYAGFKELDVEHAGEPEQRRRRVLLQDTLSLTNRHTASLDVYNSSKEELDNNENIHLSHVIMSYIEKAKAKGIDLRFLLLPKAHPEYYKSSYPTFVKLPEHSKIDYADPINHPTFYKVKNSFDRAHLNSTGAHVMTRLIVEQFNAKFTDR